MPSVSEHDRGDSEGANGGMVRYFSLSSLVLLDSGASSQTWGNSFIALRYLKEQIFIKGPADKLNANGQTLLVKTAWHRNSW